MQACVDVYGDLTSLEFLPNQVLAVRCVFNEVKQVLNGQRNDAQVVAVSHHSERLTCTTQLHENISAKCEGKINNVKLEYNT